MEIFELILILLACVIASAVLDQVVGRVSLPLIQIGVGLVVALALPHVASVQVDPELFLVLFIAPLLFNESREAVKSDLWNGRGAIVSLAVGLVLVTVLVVGFVLHLIVPSVPLAAAFAFAAALGPTDAAAVAALGPTVNLTTRQKTLLQGESLINDASGVVAFQFAIAAAVTGAFSAAQAAETFAVLFFGGILAGALMGAFALVSVEWLRMRGYVNTTVHVLYEVFTPFVVFLAAEAVGVSGILAVVAAGVVMSIFPTRTLASAEQARLRVVSESFWEIIIFLINGVIFVMLGMQLPAAFAPSVTELMHPAALFAIVVLVYVLVMGCRFVWLAVMEGRGTDDMPRTLREALVTTISGAKGAVTLSIIFTIPYLVADGTAFPARDLLIFLAAGVILLSLVVVDLTLPRLAPKEATADEDAEALHEATVAVLAGTVSELEERVRDGNRPEYAPATNLAIARYRTRLNRERMANGERGRVMRDLIGEVLDVQQRRADEIQSGADFDAKKAAPYFMLLRGIRASVGYFGGAQNVGSRTGSLRARLYLFKMRFFPPKIDDEESERMYYDTVMFAVDLERTAIDYLEGVVEAEGADAVPAGADAALAGAATALAGTAAAAVDEGEGEPSAAPVETLRSQVARLLIDEHQTALESLWGRLEFGQDDTSVLPGRDDEFDHGSHEKMPVGMKQRFGEQFARARQYADEVDAAALGIELEQINRLRRDGRIEEHIARELRESVYVMQMSLE